jgi:hypothetical protein
MLSGAIKPITPPRFMSSLVWKTENYEFLEGSQQKLLLALNIRTSLLQLILKIEKEQPFPVTVVTNQIFYLQVSAEKFKQIVMYHESIAEFYNKSTAD